MQADAFTYRRAPREAALTFRTTTVSRGEAVLADASATTRRFRANKTRDAAEVVSPGLVERLEVHETTIEQTWSLATKPAGEGDLVVRVAATGAPFVRESDRGLVFGHGPAAVEYGHGTFIDAAGARTAVPATLVEGEIELRVPRETLETAAYPAVLDPIIGPPVWPIIGGRIDWNHEYLGSPQTVWDGTEYHAIYKDTTLTPGFYFLDIDDEGNAQEQATRIVGIPSACNGYDAFLRDGAIDFFCYTTTTPVRVYLYRVSVYGVLLGTVTFPAAVIPGAQIVPGPDEYLMLWSGADTDGTTNAFAMRFTGAGVAIDAAPITIANGPRTQARPAGVYTGSEYLIVYEDDRYTDIPTKDLRATRLPSTGVPTNLDGDVVFASPTERESAPRLDIAAGRILLSFDYLSFNATNYGSLRVVELSALGVPTGPALALTAGALGSTPWRVAFNGTEWLIAIHGYNTTGDFYLNRFNPVTNAMGAYMFDDWNLSIGWNDVLWNGTEALMVKQRNTRLLARRLGTTSLIGTTSLDTYRPEMTVHDAASDGNVYAVAYSVRTNFSSTTEHTYVGILGANGEYIASQFIASPTGVALNRDETRRNMSVVHIGNGEFFVRTTYSSSAYVGVIRTNGDWRIPPTATFSYGGERLSWDGSKMLAFSEGYRARQLSLTGTSGSQFNVTSAAGTKEDIVGAANGATHLAVWTDGRNAGTTGRDIYAMRLLANGTLLDQNAIAITNAAGDDTRPDIVAVAGGWLVTWRTAAGVLATRFVALDGTTPNASSTIAFGASVPTEYMLTFRGTRGMVVAALPDGNGLAGVTFGSLGEVIEGPFDLAVDRPATGFGGVAAITEDRYLVAYESIDVASEYDQMFIRTVSAVDPLGTVCTSAADCGGGHCVDGVCCASACGGGVTNDCMACSVAAGGSINGTCRPFAANTTCRASAGNCDLPETCSGAATACPDDAKRLPGHVCRGAAGACDLAEVCDGTADVCPADELASIGTVCRSAGGECDVAEVCSGVGVACPNDVIEPAGTVCRASSGACDPQETCDGTTKTCAADTRRPDGESCGDGLGCNGEETCVAGACVAGTPVGCVTLVQCRTSVCVEPGTCTLRPIFGCCMSHSECNDGDPCTTDTCDTSQQCRYVATASCGGGNATGGDDQTPGPTTSFAPLTSHGGVDAGHHDAGADASDSSTDESGGCTVATRTRAGSGASLWLLLGVAAIVRWRRRGVLAVGALVAVAAVAAVVTHGRDEGPARPASEARALPAAASVSPVQAPASDASEFDLAGVMTRAHFAFRPTTDDALEVEDATYEVRVRRGAATIRARSGESESEPALTLETRAIGRGDAALARVRDTSVADDGTVGLDRGEAVERFQASAAGLEQSWSFADAPSGTGDLVVKVATSGLAHVRTTDTGLHFADGEGVGFRYGHATWVDARGERVAVLATYDAGAITLRVPEHVLVSSSYPAVLDPIIAPEIGIDTPIVAMLAGTQDDVAVAASPDGYLVAWTDTRSGGAFVYAARVTTRGRVLDPAGFRITSAPGAHSAPGIVFDGTNYLVAWVGNASAQTQILATRVSLDGVVLDPQGIAVCAPASGAISQPVIAFDGTNAFVVWGTATSTLVGARFTPAGVVLDASPIFLRNGGTNNGKDLTFAGDAYVLVFSDYVSYLRVFAMRISTEGVVLDPGGVRVSDNPDFPNVDRSNPQVAWDGQSLLVGWLDGSLSNGEAYARLISPNLAVPSSNQVIVVNAGAGMQSINEIVHIGDGFLVFWRNTSTGITYLTRVRANGAIGTPAATTVGTTFAVHAATDGADILAAWSTSTDVYATRIDAAATIADVPPIHVSSGGNETRSPAFASSGTTLFAAWADSRGNGNIYGSRLTPSGAPIGPAIAIETDVTASSAPDVAYDGTNFVVWWKEGTTTRGRRISTTGTVLDPTPMSLPGTPVLTSDVVLGGHGTGSIVLTGEDVASTIFNLYATPFDTSGAPVDVPKILVAPDTEAPDPALAFDGTNYLVVFTDEGDLYGRFIPPSGALPPPAFTISSASGSQRAPSVAFDGTGFLVAWEDDRNPGSTDVYAARIDATGAVLDPGGIAISTGVGTQRAPAVSVVEGAFLVAFGDSRSGMPAVRATRVTTAGVVLEPNGLSLALETDAASSIEIVTIGGTVLVGYARPTPTAEGTLHVHGRRVCSATTDATCDGVDADCDGRVDDDFVVTATTCGVGYCGAAGTSICAAGAVIDTCMPKTALLSDARCDGIDEDCDGQTDEAFVTSTTICGRGACASMGTATCAGGVITNSCVERTVSMPEICNRIDDDCDTRTDEGVTCTPGDGGTDAGDEPDGSLDSGMVEPEPMSGGGCAVARTRDADHAIAWVFGLIVAAMLARAPRRQR